MSEHIFINEIEDSSKYLLTFKLDIEKDEKLDVKKHFKNTLLVHKKGTTFYTINALNKLIEKDYDLIGEKNINYKEYKIDWDNYKDKLIIINKNDLEIIPLNRILL